MPRRQFLLTRGASEHSSKLPRTGQVPVAVANASALFCCPAAAILIVVFPCILGVCLLYPMGPPTPLTPNPTPGLPLSKRGKWRTSVVFLESPFFSFLQRILRLCRMHDANFWAARVDHPPVPTPVKLKLAYRTWHVRSFLPWLLVKLSEFKGEPLLNRESSPALSNA